MANDLLTKTEYAKMLAASGLLPAQYRQQPANLLWAIEYGEMLGLSPMAAITGIHVIEGKPTASSNLIGMLVRRAGHRMRLTGDDKHAICVIFRKDDPDFEFRSEWDLTRARNAGLSGKGTWAKYPAAMLAARAMTECARNACPDALMGVQYTPEELGAEVDAEGEPVQVQATQLPAPSGMAGLKAKLAPPETPESLEVRQEILDVAHGIERGHHPSWAADRIPFCAELGRGGFHYADIADFCTSVNRPRPSAMTSERREAMLN